MDNQSTTPVLAYTIDEFVRKSKCSRSVTYELLKTGALRAKKIGRRTIIPAPVAEAFLANLPDYTPDVAA